MLVDHDVVVLALVIQLVVVLSLVDHDVVVLGLVLTLVAQLVVVVIVVL